MQRRLRYRLSYSAQGRHKGDEVMFVSDGLELPDEWQSGRLFHLSGKRRHLVYGRMENVKPHAEMNEGPAALENFRRAMKTIVVARKSETTPPGRPVRRTTKKKAAARKS